MPIRRLKARQIIDARGDPTLEVDLITEIGMLRSSVPSYIKKNELAGTELRDEDETNYNGRSVLKAVNIVNNTIAPELLKSKLDVNQQREIDLFLNTLDGTPDKSKLGANVMLGISMAVCKAAAAKRGLPLYRYIAMLLGLDVETFSVPVPFFDVINGGKTFSNNLVFRGFFIIPTGAQNFAEAMRMGRDVYKKLEEQLAEDCDQKPPLTVTYKGAFAPDFDEPSEVFEAIDNAIKAAGHEGKVKIGFDAAANAFFIDDKYNLDFKSEDADPEAGQEPEEFRETYTEILDNNPNIVSIEDPFGNEDLESWGILTTEKPDLQIIADDIVSMNEDRLEQAVENAAANCITIKLSLAGTITEALDRVKRAREAGWGVLPCTGPGETEDNFIADFSIGICSGQIKAAAPSRSSNIAKYNQILRIEEELGSSGKYAGEKFHDPLVDLIKPKEC